MKKVKNIFHKINKCTDPMIWGYVTLTKTLASKQADCFKKISFS